LRNALAAAALKAPLTVRSSAWIDESGRLHENTRVESGVQLRGVRVLAYLEKDGEVEAQLAQSSVSVLPPAWRGGACEEAPGRYRRSVALSVTERARGSEGYGFLGRVARLAESHFLAQWSADRVAELYVDPRADSAYERALLPAVVAMEPQFRLSIEFAPLPASRDPLAVPLPFKETLRTWGLDVESRTLRSLPFALRLTLSDRTTGRVLLVDHWSTQLPESGMSITARGVPEELLNALQKKLDAWKDDVTKALICEPQRLQVVMQSGERLDLQAGAAIGVRAGDQFVLVDAERVPARMLEAGALDAASLWEVQSVDAARASARRLAGPLPAPSASRRWVALPL
jgi:hypothetical protein